MYAMPEALSNLVERGRVHRRFYTDPAVFDEEKARIFRRVWLWLGHESQLKAPGDFFTTRMAGDRRLRPKDAALQIASKRVHLLNADQDSGHLRFAIPF
jgi:hypothetical protein